jgi:hypothetical protein
MVFGANVIYTQVNDPMELSCFRVSDYLFR